MCEQALAHRRILSAPVVMSAGLEDLETASVQECYAPVLVGWFDIPDVLRGLISCMCPLHLPPNCQCLLSTVYTVPRIAE